MASYRRRHEADAGTASELIVARSRDIPHSRDPFARPATELLSPHDYRNGIGGRTTGWPSSAIVCCGAGGGNGAAACAGWSGGAATGAGERAGE